MIFGRKQRKTATRKEQQLLRGDSYFIPITIHYERRTNSRVSFGKKGLNIRVSDLVSESQQQQQIAAFKRWAVSAIASKPQLATQYQVKEYTTGDEYTIQGEQFTLQLHRKNVKTVRAAIKGDKVVANIPNDFATEQLAKELPSALSRAAAKHTHNNVFDRMMAINDRYFQKPVQELKLKYTHSVWGSCSSKGNINLSTRLLLAPQSVMDYVIVHELAHLIERNHSAKFWNIVKGVMPNYKEKEAWLKQYGHLCKF